MEGDPVLCKTAWIEGRDTMKMQVTGGLHFIKGNSAPHFSLTATTWRNGREDGGGCQHDLILEHFPELDYLASLHLSDIDGKPMHAVANGWYNLAGYFGGAGERYHVGNSERHFPCEPPAGKPWQTTEYRNPTQEECLLIWSNHCRITFEQARNASEIIAAKWNWLDMKAAHAAFIEAQSSRWAQEAKDCIARYGLVIYGDPWLKAG